MAYQPINHAPGASNYSGGDHTGGGTDYSALDPSEAGGDGPDYEAMKLYDQGKDDSLYESNKPEGEKKKQEENKGIESNIKNEERKFKQQDPDSEESNISTEELHLRAAEEVSKGVRNNMGDRKHTKKSIEEAINKAVQEEKEVIFLD